MDSTSRPPLAPVEPAWLACLCAAWCRTCDGYAPVLQTVAAEFADARPALHVRWIDIEDEADWLGDLDIETFPTVLVADAGRVLFFGPLTPQPDTLRRLLRTALQGEPPAMAVAPEVQVLAARLRTDTPASGDAGAGSA